MKVTKEQKEKLFAERGDVRKVSMIAHVSYTTIYNWINGIGKTPRKEREIINAIKELKESKQQQKKENEELLQAIINL